MADTTPPAKFPYVTLLVDESRTDFVYSYGVGQHEYLYFPQELGVGALLSRMRNDIEAYLDFTRNIKEEERKTIINFKTFGRDLDMKIAPNHFETLKDHKSLCDFIWRFSFPAIDYVDMNVIGSTNDTS